MGKDKKAPHFTKNKMKNWIGQQCITLMLMIVIANLLFETSLASQQGQQLPIATIVLQESSVSAGASAFLENLFLNSSSSVVAADTLHSIQHILRSALRDYFFPSIFQDPSEELGKLMNSVSISSIFFAPKRTSGAHQTAVLLFAKSMNSSLQLQVVSHPVSPDHLTALSKQYIQLVQNKEVDLSSLQSGFLSSPQFRSILRDHFAVNVSNLRSLPVRTPQETALLTFLEQLSLLEIRPQFRSNEGGTANCNSHSFSKCNLSFRIQPSSLSLEFSETTSSTVFPVNSSTRFLSNTSTVLVKAAIPVEELFRLQWWMPSAADVCAVDDISTFISNALTSSDQNRLTRFIRPPSSLFAVPKKLLLSIQVLPIFWLAFQEESVTGVPILSLNITIYASNQIKSPIVAGVPCLAKMQRDSFPMLNEDEICNSTLSASWVASSSSNSVLMSCDVPLESKNVVSMNDGLVVSIESFHMASLSHPPISVSQAVNTTVVNVTQIMNGSSITQEWVTSITTHSHLPSDFSAISGEDEKRQQGLRNLLMTHWFRSKLNNVTKSLSKNCPLFHSLSGSHSDILVDSFALGLPIEVEMEWAASESKNIFSFSSAAVTAITAPTVTVEREMIWLYAIIGTGSGFVVFFILSCILFTREDYFGDWWDCDPLCDWEPSLPVRVAPGYITAFCALASIGLCFVLFQTETYVASHSVTMVEFYNPLCFEALTTTQNASWAAPYRFSQIEVDEECHAVHALGVLEGVLFIKAACSMIQHTGGKSSLLPKLGVGLTLDECQQATYLSSSILSAATLPSSNCIRESEYFSPVKKPLDLHYLHIQCLSSSDARSLKTEVARSFFVSEDSNATSAVVEPTPNVLYLLHASNYLHEVGPYYVPYRFQENHVLYIQNDPPENTREDPESPAILAGLNRSSFTTAVQWSQYELEIVNVSFGGEEPESVGDICSVGIYFPSTTAMNVTALLENTDVVPRHSSFLSLQDKVDAVQASFKNSFVIEGIQHSMWDVGFLVHGGQDEKEDPEPTLTLTFWMRANRSTVGFPLVIVDGWLERRNTSNGSSGGTTYLSSPVVTQLLKVILGGRESDGSEERDFVNNVYLAVFVDGETQTVRTLIAASEASATQAMDDPDADYNSDLFGKLHQIIWDTKSAHLQISRIFDGEWHFLAFGFDFQNDRRSVQIYVDGETSFTAFQWRQCFPAQINFVPVQSFSPNQQSLSSRVAIHSNQTEFVISKGVVFSGLLSNGAVHDIRVHKGILEQEKLVAMGTPSMRQYVSISKEGSYALGFVLGTVLVVFSFLSVCQFGTESAKVNMDDDARDEVQDEAKGQIEEASQNATNLLGANKKLVAQVKGATAGVTESIAKLKAIATMFLGVAQSISLYFSGWQWPFQYEFYVSWFVFPFSFNFNLPNLNLPNVGPLIGPMTQICLVLLAFGTIIILSSIDYETFDDCMRSLYRKVEADQKEEEKNRKRQKLLNASRKKKGKGREKNETELSWDDHYYLALDYVIPENKTGPEKNQHKELEVKAPKDSYSKVQDEIAEAWYEKMKPKGLCTYDLPLDRDLSDDLEDDEEKEDPENQYWTAYEEPDESSEEEDDDDDDEKKKRKKAAKSKKNKNKGGTFYKGTLRLVKQPGEDGIVDVYFVVATPERMKGKMVKVDVTDKDCDRASCPEHADLMRGGASHLERKDITEMPFYHCHSVMAPWTGKKCPGLANADKFYICRKPACEYAICSECANLSSEDQIKLARLGNRKVECDVRFDYDFFAKDAQLKFTRKLKLVHNADDGADDEHHGRRGRGRQQSGETLVALVDAKCDEIIPDKHNPFIEEVVCPVSVEDTSETGSLSMKGHFNAEEITYLFFYSPDHDENEKAEVSVVRASATHSCPHCNVLMVPGRPEVHLTLHEHMNDNGDCKFECTSVLTPWAGKGCSGINDEEKFYVCGNEDCEFAICGECAELTQFQKFKSTVIGEAQALGVGGAIGWITLMVAQALYFPIMQTTIMLVACHPTFQCDFPNCYQQPTPIFILTVACASVAMLIVGVGFLAFLFYIAYKRKRAVIDADVIKNHYITEEKKKREAEREKQKKAKKEEKSEEEKEGDEDDDDDDDEDDDDAVTHMDEMPDTFWEVFTADIDQERWSEILDQDKSILRPLYDQFEFKHMCILPAFFLLKVFLVLPIVFLPPNSLRQLAGTAFVETVQLVFFAATNSYVNPWIDTLGKTGSLHQIYQLALMSFHRVMIAEDKDSMGMALFMGAGSGLYGIILIGVMLHVALIPAIRGILERRRKKKLAAEEKVKKQEERKKNEERLATAGPQKKNPSPSQATVATSEHGFVEMTAISPKAPQKPVPVKKPAIQQSNKSLQKPFLEDDDDDDDDDDWGEEDSTPPPPRWKLGNANLEDLSPKSVHSSARKTAVRVPSAPVPKKRPVFDDEDL